MSLLEQARAQFGRRYRQIGDLWAVEGLSGITERIRRAAAGRIAPKSTLMPVRRADVLTADLSQPFEPAIPDLVPTQSVVVNWVMVPPGPRSGGHTTLFRIIRYLESHG